ncbi:MAG: hypothetical protein ACI8V2_002634 [Candidatus Latescibacterota bacterium]|jgi:hypothetical protein
MAQTETQTKSLPEQKRQITLRAVVLGTLTAAGLNIYSDYAGMILGSASLVKSQLPIAMLMPFVAWIGVNLILKLVWPRIALSSAELLVIYSMSWIVGTVSASGWTAYWGGVLSSPTFFASPENRWEGVLFDVLPWWMLPHGEGIIRPFYEGLPDGASMPLFGWLPTLYWWFSISLALVLAGFCISILFQKQWEESERLTFPLAVFPVALTEGFDEGHRLPKIFRDPFFLAGFGVVFCVYAWNMMGYFAPNLPRIGLFDDYLTKEISFARSFPPIYLRVLPPVIGLMYLCNLDILFSFWVLRLVAILQEGLMARIGFTVGHAGQQAEAGEIMTLSSHGAMVFLAVYSAWVARHHLVRVCRVAWQGIRVPDDDGAISYRLALIGLVCTTVYVLGCFVGMGLSWYLAVMQLGLMYVGYFVVAKYTAMTGCSYLFPVGAKGGGIIESLGGTATLSRSNIVALGLINSSAFFGNTRIPAWPALPHHLRLFSGLTTRRSWVFWTVVLAFAAGFLGSCLFIIHLGYHYAGQNLGLTGFRTANISTYDKMVSAIVDADKTIFDPGKGMVWLLGGGVAWGMMMLRNRLAWWPLHPLGFAFQTMGGSRVYAFSIFLVWAAKSIILRVGGITLYERARPFFFGLVIGYVVSLGMSSVVDYVWFPDDGHNLHNW